MTDRPPEPPPGAPLPPQTRLHHVGWRDVLFLGVLAVGFGVGLWTCSRFSPQPAPPTPVAVVTPQPVRTVVTETPTAPAVLPTQGPAAPTATATPRLPDTGSGGLLADGPNYLRFCDVTPEPNR